MGQRDSGQKRQRWDKEIAVRRDRDGTDSGQKRQRWDKEIAVRRDRDGTKR